MNTNHPEIPWLEACFFENQKHFPQEELDKFAGQHIAWSWDGSCIVASGADDAEVLQRLREAGIDPGRVVLDYVEP